MEVKVNVGDYGGVYVFLGNGNFVWFNDVDISGVIGGYSLGFVLIVIQVFLLEYICIIFYWVVDKLNMVVYV